MMHYDRHNEITRLISKVAIGLSLTGLVGMSTLLAKSFMNQRDVLQSNILNYVHNNETGMITFVGATAIVSLLCVTYSYIVWENVNDRQLLLQTKIGTISSLEKEEIPKVESNARKIKLSDTFKRVIISSFVLLAEFEQKSIFKV